MAKYRVHGVITRWVNVSVDVDAESPEEAEEVAYSRRLEDWHDDDDYDNDGVDVTDVESLEKGED